MTTTRSTIWSGDRQAATVIEHGIRVRRTPDPGPRGGVWVRAWRPEDEAPTGNVRFEDDAQADTYVARFVRDYTTWQPRAA